MNRGDIYFVCLDPTVGNEINKCRPVVVVSNEATNVASPLLTVVPLTSNTQRVFSFEVLLEKSETGLPKKSKAQCHQIRTISKSRISGKLAGKVCNAKLERLNYAIRLHLGL